jgi:hypothetical protein
MMPALTSSSLFAHRGHQLLTGQHTGLGVLVGLDQNHGSLTYRDRRLDFVVLALESEPVDPRL